MKLIHTLSLAAAVIGLTACVSNKNAVLMPGASLSGITNYYVVHLSSDNAKIDEIIRDDLLRRGHHATTGGTYGATPGADALVTYQDKWMWDMTMYLLQLDVQIRNPKSDIPLATGMAMHSSLARRNPKEMVKEVLDEIFKKAGEPVPAGSGK